MLSKRILLHLFVPLLLLLSSSPRDLAANPAGSGSEAQIGTLERMLVTSGKITIDLDLDRPANIRERPNFTFQVDPISFFTVRVFNKVLRGPELGSLGLIGGNSTDLPRMLSASSNQLVIERIPPGGRFDLVLRDGKNGLIFFNIEGERYEYDADRHVFSIKDGRLLISEEFATKLGKPPDARGIVGQFALEATVYPIEVISVVNGAAKSSTLPPRAAPAPNAPTRVPGPDIVVGDLPSMIHAGSSGTQVGLGIATTSCNNGDQEVHFFQLPNTDHSVVSQNLYRMSGGASNSDRFEQIGQSWVKHTFGADQFDECSYGCSPAANFTTLGVGCSDPYAASQNASPSLLGSRAWINPFTGVFPSTSQSHTGHTHTGTSHRLLVEASDLNTTLNPGATYYAEVQYDTPQEYAWCQSHPGQCNMYNNASYRRFNVSGTTSFAFSPVGATVRMAPATDAWTGATSVTIEPAPGVDGRAFIVYKVTNPSAGVWHYEYAIHNQNLDRSVQSFTLPLGCGITATNVGFHAPPNHPGFANDGTQGNAGFSNAAWTWNETSSDLTWSCETFTQNQNANAIRYGTLYNFRFDSNRAPGPVSATIGFFKTGSSMTVSIQGPGPCSPLQITSVVSRKTHETAGTFDVDLPVSGVPGVECRSGGVNGAHTMIFTFSNNIVSGNVSVTSGIGTVSGTTFLGKRMTVSLTGVADEQRIAVTASNVTDTLGQTLPDTVVNAVMLMGDTTGNQAVNASDVAQTKAQIGATADTANFRADVNVSGTINASDVAQVKANIGKSVP